MAMKPGWCWAVAAMSQGIVLGALLEGIKVSSPAYAGGWWD